MPQSMTQQIAVTPDLGDLRRRLLLFDKVGIVGLDYYLDLLQNGDTGFPPCKPWYEELALLHSAGVIFQPADIPSLDVDGEEQGGPVDRSEESAGLMAEIKALHREYGATLFTETLLRGQLDGLFPEFKTPEELPETRRRLDAIHEQRQQLKIRMMAAQLREQGNEVYALVPFAERAPGREQHTVVEIVLRNIPTVSGEVPLSQLLEFRSDASTRRMLLALRRWIRRIGAGEVAANELKEEIEWSTSEYREHLRIHNMQASNARLRILLKWPLELVENAVRLRLSKSIDALCDVREARVALLSEEVKAPGRELSYLVHVADAFGGE